MNYDHQDIAFRIRNKAAVGIEELAGHIAGDEYAKFVYMLANNPASINDVLRHKRGFESLPFAPDPDRLAGEIDLLYKKGDPQSMDIISHLLAAWKFNPEANNWTTNSRLVDLLNSLGFIK